MVKTEDIKQIIPADNWWAAFRKKNINESLPDIVWYEKVVCFCLKTESNWNYVEPYIYTTMIEGVESVENYDEIIYSETTPIDFI